MRRPHLWMTGPRIPLRGRIFLRKLLLRPSHSRRRLSRIPSRKAAVAPAEICSAVKWQAAESRYFGPVHSRPYHIRLPARPHNPDALNTSSFRDIWPVRGFRELQCREFSSKIFRAQLANAVYDVTNSILRSRLRDVRGTPTQCRTRSFR